MKQSNYITTSPQTNPARKLRLAACFFYGKPRRNNTGKERDSETGLYYYGARYLDPKASRWISGDPATGEYVPSAPINDDARKRNQNLPGMGGVFNTVNLHAYHYAGNNPVKYVDPNGETTRPLEDDEWADVKNAIDYAVANLDSIINELTDYASGASQSISDDIVQGARDWLDKDLSSTESFLDLIYDLTKLRNNLASKTRNNFRYNNDANYLALFNPILGRITLGSGFFSVGYTGNDTKPGILVHEISHSIRVLNTQDYAYGTYQSGELRNAVTDNFGVRKNPWQNADNWEYFFERYSTGGKKR